MDSEPLAKVLMVRRVRVIRTSHQFPPIPIRDFDWIAYRDPEGPHGLGATKAEAIADLIKNYDDEEAPDV